jgi:hypothetical protein
MAIAQASSSHTPKHLRESHVQQLCDPAIVSMQLAALAYASPERCPVLMCARLDRLLLSISVSCAHLVADGFPNMSS